MWFSPPYDHLGCFRARSSIWWPLRSPQDYLLLVFLVIYLNSIIFYWIPNYWFSSLFYHHFTIFITSSEGWTLTQDRSEWRNRVRIGKCNLNQQKEADEKHRKDEQKRRCEARYTTSVLALHCDEVGCGFTALTQASLVNHQRQKHGPSSIDQCKFCHQIFNRQGLHNHKRFCHHRTNSST